MEKFCIFCGETPEDKNKEHIIPKWLIELSGDKNRPFGLYLFNKEKGYLKNESTSFEKFVFPSCSKCNSEFSDLENNASIVIKSLINLEPLNPNDFTTLLDWLDKVRIGMWLAIRYRDNNAFKVDPNFFISQRFRKADRLVKISRTSLPAKRLTISGVNSPAFIKMPSAFALTINQISLISVSNNFLLSRRMGLPYPAKTIFHENGLMECSIVAGLERVINPVIRLPIINNGTILLQSVISSDIYKTNTHLYESQYKSETCMGENSNLSNIFIQNSNSVTKMSSEHKSLEWLPEATSLESNEFTDRSAIESLKIQNLLWDDVSSLEYSSKEHKKNIRKAANLYKKFNEQLINNFEKKNYYYD